MDSIKDLVKLINHLVKYPLLTQKAWDFLLFKQVVQIISNNAHFTIDGLNLIVNIKATMNWGLSNKLKYQFAEFSPVERPIIFNESIPHPS